MANCFAQCAAFRKYQALSTLGLSGPAVNRGTS